ncbi:MAG: prepilin-type N-terminal cleavage/methylation domain-containing protein [Candidatus Omnitrophica bacterium]|nr:prepilin-type N-terminal cleavage/methylation domain-containing protein [Candidatus Omnitrophota bacterium]
MKAFTLVEVIIVVVILGIIAGLGVPMIAGPSLEKASFSEALHQLTSYVTAEKSYYFDNNSQYAGLCGKLDVDVYFKGFDSIDCSAGGIPGVISIRRSEGPEAGYHVKVDATKSPPEYKCNDCPLYLQKLLPQN